MDEHVSVKCRREVRVKVSAFGFADIVAVGDGAGRSPAPAAPGQAVDAALDLSGRGADCVAFRLKVRQPVAFPVDRDGLR
jgi:hypothetical protein